LAVKPVFSMASLSKENRNQLAKITLEAREVAEKACRASIHNLAVHEKEYRSHMSVDQRKLRNRLRARARALGDELDSAKGTQETKRLVEAAAYEHWHRLLFTRFLAENNLLISDKSSGNVPVTLEDCEELAPGAGFKNGFELACKFASEELPGVFRSDDPVLELQLALNDQVELRRLLDTLGKEIFLGDDSLGWTYQFWQAQRKDEVNESGKKIGAREISPVTQLFTEDYMVEFLLHNTLGAWWAGKLGQITAATEEEARAKAGLSSKEGLGVNWKYLRFIQNKETKQWVPAAGTFEGWPKEAKGIRFLDPCMGSGHFPVFALPILVRMRMEEESLGAKKAISLVIVDNLFGLELDERCTQIAAFNIALAAWKMGGYQTLPQMHLACCGLGPHTSEKEWVATAGGDDRLKRGMSKLHSLFKDAPMLGSLINPRASGGDLLEAEFHELQPLLEKALAQEAKDDTAHEMAVTARGLAKAAEILAGQFTLVATNVPYLGRPKQDEILTGYCERVHPEAKADLATCFVERGLAFCAEGGTATLVTPQNWLSQPRYTNLRERALRSVVFDWCFRLGEHAFESPQAAGAFVAIVSLSRSPVKSGHEIAAGDFAEAPSPDAKAQELLSSQLLALSQAAQAKNPEGRIEFSESETTQRLMRYAKSIQGLATSDDPQFTICFWELSAISNGWCGLMGTVLDTIPFGGREQLILWEDGRGRYFRHAMALKEEGRMGGWKSGTEAREKRGVLISQMRQLPVTLYLGEFYDHNACVFIPEDPNHLAAIWAFCESEEFNASVRTFDQSLKPSNNTLTKVSFDLAHWQMVAVKKYPQGLPKPFSSDPTQWLFNGHPAGADQPLHVAVARLLGYQWPRQTGSSFPDCPALKPDGLGKLEDDDGIVCIPPINKEQPAADRLRAFLGKALGKYDERALIAAASPKGSKSETLEDWIRNEFFDQHCELFHERPFIWHIWDGRKDGFGALVNYHKLDHSTLNKLTYTYLGDWIRQQQAEAKAGKPGAAERLGVAKELQGELEKILEGEPPYDIFVRWKPIKGQAKGWNPDLNDGVRLNSRPFLLAKDLGKKGAGVLRSKPNIKWDKDRGTEPQRDKKEYPWFWCSDEPGTDPTGGKVFTGNRWNSAHLTLARKKSG
jgi:hypothetical protein